MKEQSNNKDGKKPMDYEKIKMAIYAKDYFTAGGPEREFAENEAREKNDPDTLFHLAFFYNDDKKNQLIKEALEMGSSDAWDWRGQILIRERHFEEAYECFEKSGDKNRKYLDIVGDDQLMQLIQAGVDFDLVKSVFADGNSKPIDWWVFVYKKRPTPALKYLFVICYCFQKIRGCETEQVLEVVQDNVAALRLLRESSNEGFEYATHRLERAEGEVGKILKLGLT